MIKKIRPIVAWAGVVDGNIHWPIFENMELYRTSTEAKYHYEKVIKVKISPTPL